MGLVNSLQREPTEKSRISLTYLQYPPPRLHHYPIRLTGDPLDHRRKLRSVSLAHVFCLCLCFCPAHGGTGDGAINIEGEGG
jgi:hypothetical protein